MNLTRIFSTIYRRHLTATLGAVILVPYGMPGYGLASRGAAQTTQATVTQPAPPVSEASRFAPDQLDSLVAPIALYPDPLLAQVLAASTYPLEITQLEQWLGRNPGLKDQALADAVAQQPWDPTVQAMAPLPEVVKLMADDIQWTTDLGNAFVGQQADVMNAVQRMRQRAQQSGNLTSGAQQVVRTETVESKPVIVIEQANPQVVYVPSYDPTVVWGAPVYPYPSIYYPPAGYYAAGAAVSFGVGVAVGAAWGGGWGWNTGWGRNNIIVNNNNFFNRRAFAYNRGAYGSNVWQHRTPYGNRATANRFSGATRGGSLAYRQPGARQGGTFRNNAPGAGGYANRGGAAAGTAGTFGTGHRGGAAGTTGTINRPRGEGQRFNGSRPGGSSFQPRAGGHRGGGFNRGGGFSRGGGGFRGGGGRRR